jgi:tripartite-type tricarboxylate transporter receptor subunit TctC
MAKWVWALALASVLYVPGATAQNYPNKPITIVVTAAAGGVSDLVARAIAQRLSDKWGQQILIENRGGGAHIIGESAVATARPDGYTLLVAERSTFVVNPILYPKGKLPYDPEAAFVPITGLVRVHQALVTSPNFAPNTVTYGSAGVVSGPHINTVRLENASGTKLVAVHYKGATPALNDVIGGHTNMMIISVSSALSQFRAGQLKMLGIGSAKRLSQVADVPTIAESGNLPGYDANTWFGLAVTGGTPPDVVKKISTEVQAILNEPRFREQVLDKHLYESMASTPESFAANIKAERAIWEKVIREQNLVIGQ